MRKYILNVILAVLPAVSVFAQSTAAEYEKRYNSLVSRLGADGVGVETLLNKWEAAYPEDVNMLQGKFLYYFTKAKNSTVEVKDVSKYLGQKPVITLKDSTGKDVNYFQVINYDDDLFAKSLTSIEKAIQIQPDRLDLRFLKTSALVGYEKDSPDMALSYLKSVIDYNATQKPKWEYPGEDASDGELFNAGVQDYCYTLFTYGGDKCFAAFKELSEKMLKYEPNNVLFLDNMGSYYLVAAHDSKMALKYYNKVLKVEPSDLTAIKNCIILARNDKNVKLEKKYLPMLIKHTTDESERTSAQARLDYLNK